MAGIVTALLITLSGASRGWRAISAIGFMVGIATLIAAWKGMCVVSKLDSSMICRTVIDLERTGSTWNASSSSSSLGALR